MVQTEEENVIDKTINDLTFQQGKTLVKNKEYSKACEFFADYITMRINEGIESEDLSMAPIYCEYGNALLNNAEETADIFGQKLKEKEKKEQANPQVEGGDNPQGEGGSAEEVDDYQLAWEVLENARIIYSKHASTVIVKKELAFIYLRLGDLGMDMGTFPQAIEDYKKSLAIQKELLGTSDDKSPLADIYCCMAIAAVYHSAEIGQMLQEKPTTENDEKELSKEEKEEKLKLVKQLYTDALNYYYQAAIIIKNKTIKKAKAIGGKLLEYVISKFETSEKTEEKVEYQLIYNGDPIKIKDEMITSLEKQEGLSTEEADIHECLEIYTELKEKIDGLLLSEKQKSLIETVENDVTTVGFTSSVEKSPEKVAVLQPRKKKRSNETVETEAVKTRKTE